MTITFLLSISFIIFYFGMGIGTALKFYSDISIGLLPRLVLVLPLQTLLITIMVFFSVVKEVLKDLIRKPHGIFQWLYISFVRVRIVLIVILRCTMFMPIFAGRLAQIFIKDRNNAKHVMKRTRNECSPLIKNDILCFMQ